MSAKEEYIKEALRLAAETGELKDGEMRLPLKDFVSLVQFGVGRARSVLGHADVTPATAQCSDYLVEVADMLALLQTEVSGA